MVNKKGNQGKLSKRKKKQRKKQCIIVCLSFLFIELVLISLFVYFLNDNQCATDMDVYKVRAEIIQTETSPGHHNRTLYLITSKGYYITTGRYVESNQYCKELASLLLDDPKVELTVLKNSDSFSAYFMDRASTVIGIESATTMYSTMEQYNEYIEMNRFFLILSFVIFEIITIGIWVCIIVFRRAIFY